MIAWSADTYSPDEILWSTLFRLEGAPGGIPDDDSIIWGQANLLTWVDNTVSHGGNYPDCFKGMFVNFLMSEIILHRYGRSLLNGTISSRPAGSVSFEKHSKENRFMEFVFMVSATCHGFLKINQRHFSRRNLVTSLTIWFCSVLRRNFTLETFNTK